MSPQDPKPKPETFSDSTVSDEVSVADIHGSILREQQDPEDGYEPIPFWLITLFAAIVFWAGMYLAFNSGGFRADVFNADQVAWAGGGAAADAGPPDPLVVGKRLYTANCVACHQTTGAGVAGQFPTLVDSEWVLTGSSWQGDNHLVKILLQGLQGPIQVKGQTYNNAMPPWKQLSDDQIASILTFIRQEWGNQAPPIPPEFVAQIREETGDRTEPWTQAELQAIPQVMLDAASAPPAPASEDSPAEDAEPAVEAAAVGAPNPPIAG